ncbi:bifunctional tetrahydrofolate synthase/dihydrofolate synthase [Azomonas macrocytogenes]|uniref:Dihydrofolate synthase/folylpolyglutamate synthase n=1 Tax=Azomonas macrocytogenes TaxID=69962 RepID=A0A839T5F8_AZOMA|nr:bifunctional tetrahydrofolate synthase/dihydrofolate synthase [Azomonas macrocytogenes]MBB3103544.1 dihydrofolate synthase/folylpolyglutamate synthase [Azomonas macrocytogenes]
MMAKALAEWLAHLEQLHPSAIDMGLERVREVGARLGLERLAPRVVTVTGTNGKGSTCAFLASLLQTQGLSVGVYGSPHLRRYNERVCIDGVEVDDAALCAAFAKVEAARNGVTLTYFEMGTLAAFCLFQAASLDAVVLEVGLGGRLDAVNLVDADLAIVTSIGLDHTEWLGDTRESVAYEKAGIFRPGKPAICGDADPPATLLQQAQKLNTPLFLVGRDFGLSVDAADWQWRGCRSDGNPLMLERLPLLELPMENAALALQALALLGLPLGNPALALQQTRLAGRLDRRLVRYHDKDICLLLDVGHNPHAAAYLACRLVEKPPAGIRRAVFGLLADKDLDGILEPLSPLIDKWAVATLQTPRARLAADLERALSARQAQVSAFDSLVDALDAQCEQAADGDEILVFGSFYCVAECLDWLDRNSGR